MEIKNTKKLPVWWLIILAPLGFGITTLFYKLSGGNSYEIQKILGISQSRIFSLLIYTLSTGFAVFIYWLLLKSKKLSLKKAGYRGKLTKNGVYGALLALLITSFILYPLLTSILGALDIPMFWKSIGDTAIKQNSVQDLILGILTTVILAPLTEDTIFRGYVFQMFSERTNKWIAMVVSALLFAVIHISFFGPGLTIWVFFFGLVSAYLYKRFDNIYPSLLFHALNNLWSYILVPLIFY
ncbi:CPBP family intramembrane metalloprotease [Weeksellaceae bacterium TAE3-ERU29]|nr:CPBP family intramembrane metalloprotease [Weeksellaceae bacterium TAE3-ERU29]